MKFNSIFDTKISIDDFVQRYNNYYNEFKIEKTADFLKDRKLFCISSVKKDTPNFTYLPFLALIEQEQVSDDKIFGCSKKIYQFIFLTADGKANYLNLCDDEIDEKVIKKAVRKYITGYGPITDTAITIAYNTALEIAQLKTKTQHIYCEEGLSLDNTRFVYRGLPLDITQNKFNLTKEEKEKLHSVITDILSCSKCPAVMTILLETALMSLLYEAFLKMQQDQAVKLIPSFLIFIYGESGSGKTTVSRAIFRSTDPKRFIYVPNSTSASMQEAIKKVSSGVLLFDDIPHTGYDKCSTENKSKLEMLIRAAGDFGAEKRTAKSELPPLPKRAALAVTSEAPFYISESSSLRCLYCHIEKGSIDFEKFSRYRESGNELDSLNQAFIKWAFSELLKYDGTNFSMPVLEALYIKAANETRILLDNVVEPRAMDNFIHIELYWHIYSLFLKEICFSESELSEMQLEHDVYLKKSASIQQEIIKFRSAESAIYFTIEKVISSNRTVSFKKENNQLTRISLDQTDNSEGTVIGFYNSPYLILTSEQQKIFFQCFNEIYSEKLKNREIIDLMYKMSLVVKPVDGSVFLSKPATRTKIKISNIERDVIIIRYKSKEEYSLQGGTM